MSATYKKCIVLDLDNTLWGGVVGEDGIEGIKLSHMGEGAPFMAFQQALLDLYHRGVLLAINSHNNSDDALPVIRTHQNMILKEHHFAAVRINWEDKTQNIQSIANELSLGVDSMVFLDDNPLQRASVRALLPEVDVPELPTDPQEYVRTLQTLPYFPKVAQTNEDALRGNLYVTERMRKSAESTYASQEAFLKDLKLEAHIGVNDHDAIARVAQLTDKTNQFNTAKTPLTEAEVQSLMDGATHKIYTMRVTDRFGDYGTIGVAIVATEGATWHVSQLLMSCRILGRGVEQALISTIRNDAKEYGAPCLSFAFVPTERNIPARTFLESISSPPYQISLSSTSELPPSFVTIITTS